MKQYNYDYPENRKVLVSMIHGDYSVIHEITGYSVSYISNVMQGKRKNTKIIEVAESIVIKRNQLKAEFIPE